MSLLRCLHGSCPPAVRGGQEGQGRIVRDLPRNGSFFQLPEVSKQSVFNDSSSLFFFWQTHVPFAAIYSRPHEAQIRVETGLPCPHDTGVPKNPRKETDEILRLAGLQAY